MSAYQTKAKSRHGSVCQNCADLDNIEVHHIDGNRENNQIENLIPLCTGCHVVVHTGERTESPLLEQLQRDLPPKSEREYEEDTQIRAVAYLHPDTVAQLENRYKDSVSAVIRDSVSEKLERDKNNE